MPGTDKAPEFTVPELKNATPAPAPTKEDGGSTTDKPQEQVVDLKRSDLTDDMRSGKEAKSINERVRINKEVEQEYKQWMSKYVDKFARALKDNPALARNHAADVDRTLVEMLTTDGVANEDKIADFFTRPDGWALATETMSKYAFYAAAASGYSVESVTDEHRPSPNEAPRLRLADAKFFGTSEVKLVYNTETFLALKSSRIEAEYTKAITGIDVSKYGVAPATPGTRSFKNPFGSLGTPEQIALIAGKIGDPRPIEVVRGEILTGINARRDFLKALGISPDKFDSLPEEAIANDTLSARRNFRAITNWDKDIIAAYNADAGGFRVGDRTGNILRFNEARRSVMLRKTAEMSEKVLLGKDLNKIRTSVKDKLTSLDNGTEVTKRSEAAKKRKENLDIEKKEVATKRHPLTALEEKQQILTSLETKLQTEYGGPITSAATFVPAVDAEIQKLIWEANGNPATPAVLGLRAKWQTARTEWENLVKNSPGYGPTTDKRIREELGLAMEKVELDDLIGQIKEVDKKQAGLKALKNEYINAEKVNNRERDVFINNPTIPKDLTEIADAYEAFVNVRVANPALNITPIELQDKTIDELVARAANPAGPYRKPNSTPEDQKILREFVIRAKTEHKARQEELRNVSPQAQIDAFNKIIIAGGTVKPNSLLTIPPQQLSVILAQPPHSLLPPDIQANLPLAINEAKKQFVIRYRIEGEEMMADFDSQIKTQEKIIKDLGNVDELKKIVRLTDNVLGRAGPIFGKAKDIASDRQKYTNTTRPIAADTEYSKAEKDARTIATGATPASPIPRGYYEMLDVFFDYQAGTKTTSREAGFQEAFTLLPPEKMARLLWESLNGPPPAHTDITFVLNRISANIAGGYLSADGVYRGLKRSLEKLGKEAIAL